MSEVTDYDDYEDEMNCPDCHGEGVVKVCIDDCCRGLEEDQCLLGRFNCDGIRVCRTCKGDSNGT